MRFGLKHFLTAGIACVLSAVMFAAPAAAVAAEAELSDRNGDGVINVFDFVLSKRAVLTESAPLDLQFVNGASYPGGLAVIGVAAANNPGFSNVQLTFSYDEALSLETLTDEEDFIAMANSDFPKLRLTTINMPQYHQISCLSAKNTKAEGDGVLFELAFRVPEDAVPGTVYQIAFEDAVIYDGSAQLPLMIERGTLTVTEKPDMPDPVPEVTTTALTEPEPVDETTTEAVAATDPETAAEQTSAEITTVTTVTTAETTEPPIATTHFTQGSYLDGIDISVWQGDVNFAAVREQGFAKFVILRAGFGRFVTQEDIRFSSYYSGCRANGLPVGAYWYSYADTPEAARIEANTCAQVLGNRKFEYPIAFDIEEPSVLAKPAEELGAIIDAFCSELEKKGYYTVLYCSSFYLNNCIPRWVWERYDVWCAHYNVSRPTFVGQYGIWQYGLGKCNGINGDVDVDYCYRDYPTVIREKHLNGY